MDNSKTLLLTFETITNPIVLLQSLIIQRNIGGKLLVREENMRACNDQGMHEYVDDLRDPKFIDYLDGWIVEESGIKRKGDLSIVEENIILCLQILQFALNEGYIEIISDKYNENDKNILNSRANKSLYNNMSASFDYGIWVLTNQWLSLEPKACIISDIKTATEKGYILAIGNNRKNFSQKFTNIFKSDHSAILKESLGVMKFDDFKDICYLIEKPKIMTTISYAFAKIIEKKNLQQDAILFMPRLLMGNMTLGLSGLTELIWRYHKKGNS